MTGVMEDREMWVRRTEGVRCDWVHVDDCVLGLRKEMDVAAIERAYRKLLQMDGAASWPPVIGEWRGDRFVVLDGRHEFLATLALGREEILCAWKVGRQDPDAGTITERAAGEVYQRVTQGPRLQEGPRPGNDRESWRLEVQCTNCQRWFRPEPPKGYHGPPWCPYCGALRDLPTEMESRAAQEAEIHAQQVED